MKEIIGRKMGMTQVYAEDGTMYAVSVIEVLPNVVTQIKTKEKDGYEALQVGYEDKKENRLNKCEKGIFEKANVSGKQHLFELQGEELKSFAVGSEIKADLFKAGEVIDVIGTSKGRGFSGVIKRWHQHIGPKGHGSGYHRQIGSLANNGLGINRVMPGKRMPGHMGAQSSTILNLNIIKVDLEGNYILVKGGIPGPKKGLVKIRSAIKTNGKDLNVKPLINRAPKVEVEEASIEASEVK